MRDTVGSAAQNELEVLVDRKLALNDILACPVSGTVAGVSRCSVILGLV